MASHMSHEESNNDEDRSCTVISDIPHNGRFDLGQHLQKNAEKVFPFSSLLHHPLNKFFLFKTTYTGTTCPSTGPSFAVGDIGRFGFCPSATRDFRLREVDACSGIM